MSEPILPLAVWQSGTNENSIPANDNALRLEALTRPCLGVANDEAGGDAQGDVWIVGSAPMGAFATFEENDIAIFDGAAWHAWAPVGGVRLVVSDIRKVYVGESTDAWEDDPSTGGGAAAHRYINVALSDMTTNLTTGTDVGYWVAPEDGTLVDIWISLIDPSSSGTVRIDANLNSAGSMLSTRPAIDATEFNSLNGTSAVISSGSFLKGDRIRFDLDDAGTDAKGLQVILEYAQA